MSLKIKKPQKNFDRPLSHDLQTQFTNFLFDHGLEPDPQRGLVTDGSVGRAFMNVGGQRKKVGWYQF